MVEKQKQGRKGKKKKTFIVGTGGDNRIRAPLGPGRGGSLAGIYSVGPEGGA